MGELLKGRSDRAQAARAWACRRVMAIAFGCMAQLQLASAQPAADRDVDELFRRERWSEARAVYDASARKVDQRSRLFLDARRGAVLASLKLKDYAGALDRVTTLIPQTPTDRDNHRLSGRWIQTTDEEWQAKLSHLESARELLGQILAASQGAGDEFSHQLTATRLALDQQLVRHLDPPREAPLWGWDSALTDVDWWWKDVAEAQEFIRSDERYSHWGWPIRNVLGRDGQPVFLESPREYVATLPRSKKLLFVLDEIEKLDRSMTRNAAAAALFARARLMRRLYGPQTDVEWSSNEFYYRYDRRPSFVPSKSTVDLKETWELADHEARTNIGERSRVIVLPESQSPLALLARLERDYPQSESAPAAVHERGLYYQSRKQFAKAIDEYRREIKQFPDQPLAIQARAQIARIMHADVMLGRTGIYSSGLSPQLWFACRNADKVEFAAHRFDLEKWMKVSDDQGEQTLRYGSLFMDRFSGDIDEDERKRLNPFIGAEAKRWTVTVDRSDRVVSHSTAAPLTEAGAYLVEARVPGSDQSSRGLVVVSGIAIVQKPLGDRVLLWVVDPRSGKPLANQKVLVTTYQHSRDNSKRETTLTSDPMGAAEYRPVDKEEGSYGGFIFASAEGRGVAFGKFDGYFYESRSDRETQVLALTDRPVYRPGATVNFRVWLRERIDRSYLPAEMGLPLQIMVEDPNYHTIRNVTLATDDSGSVAGSFTLGNETPLGEYQLSVRARGSERDELAGLFRVEEYKSPEFEVTVSPAKSVTRPGESVSARIQARYYFGSPVAKGEVDYHIFREEQRQAHSMPGDLDWLYGDGYGTLSTEGSDEDTDDFDDEFDWRFRHWGRAARREEIDEGRTRLDADGRAEIRFDPATFKPTTGMDWRYIIEVQVRDEGRRTVEASGSVVVPWQEFYAFAELDRGWYAPGETVVVDFHARSGNGLPVAAAGKAFLCRLEGPSTNPPRETMNLQDFDMTLDAEGHQKLTLTAPAAGRYRIEFNTHDSSNREVSAAVDFWVYQPGADLRHSSPPALQIVADRRTYRVGDTARLLVVTASADAHVLIFDREREYRFLSVSNHGQVLEIPIDDKGVPDIFVEGTAVWEGAVHTRVCRMFVPPVREMLKVELTTDKLIYSPGDKGKLKLKATDSEGRPVTGDLALTAFDKAITYIQPESKLGPNDFLAALRTSSWERRSEVFATLDPQRFETSGAFMCPEFYLTDDYSPQMGGMGGAPPEGGDPGGSPAESRRDVDASERSSDTVLPKIRSRFSDTALWQPHIKLDESGLGEAEITFPESLTTWHFRGYLITKETRVGDVALDVLTTKNLLVRLQRPRFLVERDEVVLSAIVHNNLKSDKSVAAELLIPARLFRAAGAGAPDADGNLRLRAQAQVPAGNQHRFDWVLTVIDDGLATVTVRGVTDEESDAMRTAIPVHTHGTLATTTQTSAFHASEAGAKALAFDVPDDADPRKTRIGVSLAPTPASVAFEAIPYLAGYPYGCVEQTMSRFYPTVLAARTLKQLGIDLSELVEKSAPKSSPFRGASAAPFLDAAELERMTEAGLQRLLRFQHPDGGWGWWEHDESSPYMTAYVLTGLHVAAESGAKVDQQSFQQGVRYLASLDDQKQAAAASHNPASRQHTKMMVVYALALGPPASFREQEQPDENERQGILNRQLDTAFTNRDQFSLYDQLLLALALRNHSSKDRSVMVLQEVLKKIDLDDERGTAHLPVQASNFWCSWNSEIETNAWLLRALVAIDRENSIVPKLVQWLALNRKYGRFWRNTQDTALAVTAISEYLAAVRERGAEQTVLVRLDKGPATTVRMARGDILGMETILVPPADKPLAPGRHQVTVERSGTGILHVALHTEFLRKNSFDKMQGNGIAMARRYFNLGPSTRDTGAAAVKQRAGNADKTDEERRLLTMNDTIAVGNLIEVELTIKSDEDFEYVAFEDMKPAGCEAVQIQSGHTFDGDLWANVELRDDRVVFFAPNLSKGTHILRYKLRAETPGWFYALPARGFAMYAPEIHAQSDALKLRVRD